MHIKLMLFFSLVLIGCSGEGEKSGQPIQVDTKTGASSCLTHFSDQMESYLDGKMSEVEVDSFWRCISSAVEEFAKITTGSVGGKYLPESIWAFLHKYFLVDQVVDADLLRSLMELKRTFVGGDSNFVTKAELYTFSEFLSVLKGISQDLRPHIRTVAQRDPAATDSQLADANAAIERSMARFSQWMSTRDQSYPFLELQKLVEGLARNSKTPDDWKKIVDAIPVLAQAKGIVVGLPKEAITSDQWQAFFLSAGTGYGLLLNWHYGFDKDIIGALSRPLIRDSLDRAAVVLEQGVRARERVQSNIALTEFDQLFQLMFEREWLGEIKAEALSKALRWIVARLLTKTVPAKLPTDAGIEMTHVQVLRGVLNDWDDVSLFADRWPGGTPIQDRVREYASVLTASWPRLVDTEGRSLFLPPTLQLPYDLKSLHVSGWQYMVISWLRDAYLISGKEFSIDDMELAVSEVLPILQEFDLLTQTPLSVFNRLQKEGDLFMPSSDGNLKISVAEGTDFLGFLISSFNLGRVWKIESEKVCAQPISPDCERDVLYSHRFEIFTSMPALQIEIGKISLDEWRKFSKKVERTVLPGDQEAPWVLGDRCLYFMLIHYLESFVRKFDSDEDNRIQVPESLVAYDQFEDNLIKLFSPLGMSDANVKPFFTFLLKHGETYFERLGGEIEFIRWKRVPETWQYDANRDILVNILYELSKL